MRDRLTTNHRNALLCSAVWLFCCLTALSSISTSFAADATVESPPSIPQQSLLEETVVSSSNNRVLANSTAAVKFSRFKLQPKRSSLKGEVEASSDEQPRLLLPRVLKGDDQPQHPQETAAANDEQQTQEQQLVLKRQQQKQKQKQEQLVLKKQRGKRKRHQHRGNKAGKKQASLKPSASGQAARYNNNNNNWSSGKLCPCPTSWQGTTKWWGGRKLFHDSRSSSWRRRGGKGGKSKRREGSGRWSSSSGYSNNDAWWSNGWWGETANGWSTSTSSYNRWDASSNYWNSRSSSWGIQWCPCPIDPPTMKPTEVSKTIVDIAVEAGVFSTLVELVHAADLVDTLSGEGPFTVLAPTDDAFALLPDGIVNQLLLPENVEILRNILLLHVIEGEIDSSMVSSGFVTTLSGVDIEAVVSDSGISFNDSRVIQADLEANNGIIHVIDGVLLPPVE